MFETRVKQSNTVSYEIRDGELLLYTVSSQEEADEAADNGFQVIELSEDAA